MCVITDSYEDIKLYYDKTLNVDKSTYKSSNDEPTPLDCVNDMISKIPEELFGRKDLSILDPCCGNGNFFVPLAFKLLNYHNIKDVLENILHFNDINENRLQNVRKVFCENDYKLNITNQDFTAFTADKKYDLIVANPPYAKLLENGARASKNHNLIKVFIEKSLSLLKPNGYLLFITPDNWMSYADRNKLIETLTSLQIIHLDIHTAKKYFKKIGSSFTWYIIQNCYYYTDISVSGTYKKKEYTDTVKSMKRKYIPLFYNQIIQDILLKTVENPKLPKFKVETSSDLHKYTKAKLISASQTDVYIHKLIHTPKQTVYASRPHKFQEGYKVFISTTDKYDTFVDNCGMTQSIAFIRCKSLEEANRIKDVLQHPVYIFINNICRWGNFNNIRVLQSFPIPEGTDAFDYFGITRQEQEFINSYL